MKKETTFLKLFTLLTLCCLNIGYAWADDIQHTQVINFDRNETSSADTLILTSITNGRENVPKGATYSMSGWAFEKLTVLGVQYWGYTTENKWFSINFNNFKHKVTNITISVDGSALSFGQAGGHLVSTSYDGNTTDDIKAYPGVTTSYVSKTNGDINLAGLKSVKYTHDSHKIWFDKSNFLLITYINPKISNSNTSTRYLGIGDTYKLEEGTESGSSDIYWENQGAFTMDDIKFTSSDNNVVTVSQDGTLTGVGYGTATITAKIYNNGEKIYAWNETTSQWVEDTDASFSFNVEINKSVTVGNDVTAENLASYLEERVKSSTTTIDLRNANNITGIDASSITRSNPNTLIYGNSGQLTNNNNESNVIVGSVCNLLKLQDGSRFSVTEAFKATSTEYVRENTDTWGAICLPYAPVPTTTTKYYALTGVGSSSLTFTIVDEPQANTPYLYKNTTGDNYSGSINSTTDVLETPTTMETSITGYKMCGAFNPTSVVNGTDYEGPKNSNYDCITDANAYYFKNNQFNKLNGRFNMAGFRAYLTNTSGSGNAKAASLFIDFCDDVTTGMKFIEDEKNGTVDVVFDTYGRRLNVIQKGINIIKGKKILVK